MSRPIPLPKQEAAIKMFYEKTELSTRDINDLFGGLSSSTIARLKRKVKDEMVKRGVYTWQAQNVNTRVAYEVWKIDIDLMEKGYNKLKKMGLLSE